MKRTFSGQPDNIIRPIREVIKDNFSNGFPLKEITEKQKGSNKDFSFNDDEIENLFYYQWGQAYTFSVLAILYPGLDFRNKFHIGHIFPKSMFTRTKLQKKGIPDNQIDFYLDNFNFLVNLQLLAGTPNIEKSDKQFDEWLDEAHPIGTSDRDNYLQTNYIPSNSGLKIEDFKSFIENRKELMADAFRKLIK